MKIGHDMAIPNPTLSDMDYVLSKASINPPQ